MQKDFNQEELRHLIFLENKYKIHSKIGEGTFSVVYKAEEKHSDEFNNKLYAIKAITKTTAPNRIIEELQFLKELEGKNNVIPLLWVHRMEDQICAIFPYLEFIDFKIFLSKCGLEDIRYYIYNLIIAVKHCHDHKIIHRDIKPGNFLYNMNLKKGMLIDFGLAQREKEIGPRESILEDKSNVKKTSLLFFDSSVSRMVPPPGYYVEDIRPAMKAQKAGTRGYRAPEVLFKSHRQGCKIDMWSVGVILLTLCTKQYPFFHSLDEIDSIAEIATIFGHEEVRKAAKYYDRIWKSNLPSIPNEPILLEKIVFSINKGVDFPVEIFDLLYKLLELNGDKRISAEDALKHPFFDILNKKH